jgi:CDP-diacylglycerol--serine O-phosphatidyltransferase
MIRFMNAANALTLAGLGAALASALLSTSHQAPFALAALIVAGLCDLFDGLVARRLRRTEEEARFGARLDSLVDACSFGFAPTLLLYEVGLRSPPELALIGLFAGCAVWRLAYFDTVGIATEGSARYYTGLPTTFVALVLPLACAAGFLGAAYLRQCAAVAALLLAIAMVSPVRVRKPGGAAYGVLLLVAIGLIALYVAGRARFAVS